MKRYKNKFVSEGVEFFFDNSLIFDSITFNHSNEPPLRRDRLEYAASTIAAMINQDKKAATRNADVFRWLEQAGVARDELKEMLKCLMDGKCYKDVVRATGLRISMLEIHIGLQIVRMDDEEHFAFSYLSIPLVDTGGRIVFRDSEIKMFKAYVVWDHGMIQRIS